MSDHKFDCGDEVIYKGKRGIVFMLGHNGGYDLHDSDGDGPHVMLARNVPESELYWDKDWIPIDKELPPYDKCVPVICQGRQTWACRMVWGKGDKWTNDGSHSIYTPSHWFKLPEFKP